MWIVFFFDQLKCELGVHVKIDRCLVHVDDKTPVAIRAKDNVAHERHGVEGIALNFGWHVLQRVRAHLIGKQMGNKKAFHSTAARCEALHAGLGQEKQRPQYNNERVDGDPCLHSSKM